MVRMWAVVGVVEVAVGVAEVAAGAAWGLEVEHVVVAAADILAGMP